MKNLVKLSLLVCTIAFSIDTQAWFETKCDKARKEFEQTKKRVELDEKTALNQLRSFDLLIAKEEEKLAKAIEHQEVIDKALNNGKDVSDELISWVEKSTSLATTKIQAHKALADLSNNALETNDLIMSGARSLLQSSGCREK